mmetsp:Transcript_60836/g.162726  ORF Transcript_60836/g.162726 Transcript_60836/m.162726 type:complete len:319 (-) Transcript_60836:1364-2320(-)
MSQLQYFKVRAVTSGSASTAIFTGVREFNRMVRTRSTKRAMKVRSRSALGKKDKQTVTINMLETVVRWLSLLIRKSSWLREKTQTQVLNSCTMIWRIPDSLLMVFCVYVPMGLKEGIESGEAPAKEMTSKLFRMLRALLPSGAHGIVSAEQPRRFGVAVPDRAETVLERFDWTLSRKCSKVWAMPKNQNLAAGRKEGIQEQLICGRRKRSGRCWLLGEPRVPLGNGNPEPTASVEARARHSRQMYLPMGQMPAVEGMFCVQWRRSLCRIFMVSCAGSLRSLQVTGWLLVPSPRRMALRLQGRKSKDTYYRIQTVRCLD